MQYITQKARKVLDPAIQLFFEEIEKLNWKQLKSGEMNYIVTKIIHWWISNKGLKYKNLNAAIGVLDCAKMELYRCVAAPYEDKKKVENGFISDLDRITKDEKQAIYKCKKCDTIFATDEIYALDGCCTDKNNWICIRESI